jgi:hypothetical protein
MALNAQERATVARSLLECFDSDSQMLGRFLGFLQVRGGVSLLADCQTQALTWAPFVDGGLSIAWWNGELARITNMTIASIT